MTHKCGRCGESFSYKHHLKQHYTRQTVCESKVSMKTYETLLMESFPAKKERIYPCGYCDKAYTQQPNRSRHHATCVAKQTAIKKAQEAASQVHEVQDIASTSTQASTSQNIVATSPNSQQVDLLEEIRSLKEKVFEMELMVQNRVYASMSDTSTSDMSDTVMHDNAPTLETGVQDNKPQQNKKKQNIPNSRRIASWNEHIGIDIGRAKCMCCQENIITQHKFNCGHVLSEAHGGTIEVSNLRPICYDCNNDMGSENMKDFALRVHNVTMV